MLISWASQQVAMKLVIDSLYASGAQGFWADLQGTPQLYTNTAGTTVAALGDSVARVNDRSGRGNNAIQATAGNRPVYARHPKSGIRNLLTYTEDFSNAAWVKGTAGSISGSPVTDPDGGNTASAYTWASSTAAFAYLSQTSSGISQNPNTYSVWLRRPTGSGSRTIRLSISDVTTSTATSSTFTVTESWQQFTFTRTSPNTTGLVGAGLNGGATGTPIAAGEVLHIWHPQLEPGSTATTYQKVTGWYDVTEAGVPSVPYLYFNGTSTSMATSAIDFSAGDKMTVFAAVQKLSDAGRGTIVELTASAAANNGAFHMTAPNAASATIAFESKGTALVDAVASSGVAAPKTAILMGAGSIAGDTATLRVNGALADTDTGDQGTGNYANAAIYLCARGGSSLYFKGNLYDLAIVAAAQTDATIAAVETKLNSTVGAY